jgi:hypothetical protein
MKTYAARQLPTYQLIGDIVRVHWDGQTVVIDEQEQYCYEEIVVPKTYTPEQAAAIGVPPDIADGFLPENFVEDQHD